MYLLMQGQEKLETKKLRKLVVSQEAQLVAVPEVQERQEWWHGSQELLRL